MIKVPGIPKQPDLYIKTQEDQELIKLGHLKYVIKQINDDPGGGIQGSGTVRHVAVFTDSNTITGPYPAATSGPGFPIFLRGINGATNGGNLTIHAGAGATGNGGIILFHGGDGEVDGGDIAIQSGEGATGNGGGLSLETGEGQVDGGNLLVKCGNGTTGAGGELVLTAGDGATNGGNITLNPGNKGAGIDGKVFITKILSLLNAAPAFANDAAAGIGGLVTGDIYQTTGGGSAPLNAAGILMIKQ